MMRELFAIILVLVANSTIAQQKDNAAMIAAAAGKAEAKVIAWREDIHANPELGNRETRTSALVANHLLSPGMEVKTGITKTGVNALTNLVLDYPGTLKYYCLIPIFK
jgi:hypothetical protein